MRLAVTTTMDEVGDEITVDVTGLEPDVVTVDALARLQLAARRAGREIRLARASPELLQLIELCGLSRALVFESDAE